MAIKIAPSILSADFGHLLEQVALVEKAGADWLHIDVMDGHFVPNITIGPIVVEALKGKTKLFLDTHLMIEHPEKYVEQFAKAGSQLITVHWEACKGNLGEVIELIKKNKCKVGLAINPDTDYKVAIPYLDKIDLVLIMSVYPGFGGQEFIAAVLPKAEALKKEIKHRKLKALIEIDGGIGAKTAPLAVKAGVDVLVAGAAIFKSTDIKKAVKDIMASADSGL